MRALCAIARLHHLAADPATLSHQLALDPRHLSPDDLIRAAQHLGLRAKRVRSTPERLASVPLPALAVMTPADSDAGEAALHLKLLAQCDGQRVLTQDFYYTSNSTPVRPTIEPLESFTAAWTGELILFTSRASLAGAIAKFDFSWFIPALVKHRKLLGEVLLISCMLQLFAMVSPLFFQVVMDKVLVHRGLTTLDVLVIGLVVVVVFESLLTGLRGYQFNLGDGSDSVYEDPLYTSGEGNILVFGAGIKERDITARRQGNDLVFAHSNGTDKATVIGWFARLFSSPTPQRISKVRFTDEGVEWLYDALTTALLTTYGTSGQDTIGGSDMDDTIYGMAGNDHLSDSYGNNKLYGGAGDDRLDAVHTLWYINQPGDLGANALYGEDGNDLLWAAYNARNTLFVGGRGDDTISGSQNSDTYRFELGDGKDTISGYAPVGGAEKKLIFGQGIAPADITVVIDKNGAALLRHKNNLDQVAIQSWTTVFFEKTSTAWTAAEIASRALHEVLGTNAGEALVGTAGKDYFRSLGGNDTLSGGAGDDQYLFAFGDGHDAINDNDATSGNVDAINFAAGVAPAALTAIRTSDDLVLRYSANDSVRIENWFAGPSWQIERVVFGDSSTNPTTWSAAQLTALAGTTVNVGPQATNLGAAETYTEDVPLNLTDIVVTDADSANVTMTLALSSAAAGSLSTGTSGLTTSTFHAVTGVWTASGAMAEVNALLAEVTFTPKANFNGIFSVSTSVSDGVAAPLTGIKSFTGVAVNDAPTATSFDIPETYTEDVPLKLASMVTTDVDSSELKVTFSLPSSAGTLTVIAGGGPYTNNSFWVTGTPGSLTTLLSNVVYTPKANYNGSFNLTISVSDGVAPAVTRTKTFTGIAVNDAPTGNVSVTGTLMIGQTLNVAHTLADVDGMGSLSYQWQSSDDGIAWGAVAGATSATLVLTQAQVGRQLRAAVSYVDAKGTPESVTSAPTTVVLGSGSNSAPSASNMNAAESYTEDVALNLTDIVVSDADSANLTVTLTLSNAAAGALNTATSGSVTSIYNAGTGVWSASGLTANVNTLLSALTYTPTAQFNGNFTVAVNVSDGLAAPVTGSKVFTGVAVNDAPNASNLSAAQTYTEDVALNLVDIVASDVDSPNLTVKLTLSNVAAGSFNTGTSGAVTSTYTAATGVWTASGATANVNALLAALTFTPAANFNGNFTVATSVSDGVAVPITGSKAFTGVAVNDAPTGSVSVSGTLAPNQTLTATNTLADVDGLGTVAYQWQSSGDGTNWTAIAGATGSTFVLGAAQVGQRVRAKASYTDAKGTVESVASAATAIVVGANAAPNATNLSAAQTYTEDVALNLIDIVASDADSANLTVSLTMSNVAAGTLNVGTSGAVTSIYNASTGVWTAGGATASVNALLAALTFLPSPNFNGSFTVATSVSDGVAPPVTGSKSFTGVAVNDAPTGTVSIAGTSTQSQTLTASHTLADVDGLGTVAYQWQASSDGVAWTAIAGATGSTLALTQAQVDKRIRVSAAYADAKGTLESMASAATGVVANVNDAPTAINLSTSETYTEDVALNLADIVASDADSANLTVTLTMSNVAAGALNVGTSGAVTSTYNAGTGVWTASGATANVNALLAALTFTPAANFNGGFSVATSVSDGIAASITGSKVFTGVAVNDAPTATNLGAAQPYTEDVALNLVDIVAADVDSASLTVTLTMSNVAAGALNVGTSGAVTSTYNVSTGVWTASGATTNVNSLLAALTFTPSANFNGSFSVATGVSDGVAPTVTGSKSFTGIAVNDVPTGSVTVSGTATQNQTLTAGHNLADVDGMGAVGYQWQSSTDGTTWSNIAGATASTLALMEAQVGKQVRVNASYTDGKGTVESRASSATTAIVNVNDGPSGSNLGTAETYTEDVALNLVDIVAADIDSTNLTVTLTLSNAAAGRLNTGTSGAVTSTYNAGTGVWTVSGATANVNALLAALSFTPSANSNGNFSVATSVSDGIAAPVTGTKSFTGIAVNDAPTGAVTIGGAANQNQTLTVANTLADVDGLGTMSYQWQSSTDGTTWSAIAGATASTLVLSAVQVGRRIRVTAGYTDARGTVESVASAATSSVAAVNAAPTATSLSVAQSYTEDLALNLVDIVVADADSANLTVTLTLSNPAAGVLITGTAGAVTSAYNAATGVWTASGAMTSLNTLLAALTFTPALNFNGSFTVATSVSDGVAAPVTGSKSFSGVAVNDAPTVANALVSRQVAFNQAFTHGLPANTFADVDAGDGLTLSATLAGTALPAWLSFDTATRTFSGTPPAAAAGTLNLTIKAVDTAGASISTAFVLEVTGAATNTISGTAGADNLVGTAGNDVFLVSGSTSALDRFEGAGGYDIIQGSAGDDTIRTSSFSGAATVEKIDGGPGTNVIAGSDARHDLIDLSGTELANIARIDTGAGDDTVIGSAGNDVIVGGASSDVLGGGAGNDTFLVNGDSGLDRYSGDAGYDVILGSAGDDTIRSAHFSGTTTVEKIDGGLGVNVIAGSDSTHDLIDLSGIELVNIARIDTGAGDDTVIGSAGNDVIVGGAGRDVLSGAAGNDTFLVSGDSGLDRYSGDAGYDMILGGAGDDTIRSFSFSGTATVEKIDGGLGVNVIAGSDSTHDLIDLSGTELVNIARIDAGGGGDTIKGSAGSDVIVGGAGNDALAGGAGNDTYRWGRGFGVDTVQENDTTAGNTDVAWFEAGIAADQLWFRQVSGNLEVSLIGTADKLTISNWYGGNQYHLEQFKTSDGKTLLDSQVQALVDAMAGFAPPAAGQTTLPAGHQTTLAPVIAANWH